MKNTPFATNQSKNRNPHPDINTRENQDAAETSELRDSPTQINITARSQADKLDERLIDFAVRIIKLAASLPKSAARRHVPAKTENKVVRHYHLMGAINYRTGSGPGSPSGQPAWGGGSDLAVATDSTVCSN
jgi:hypothetical protein